MKKSDSQLGKPQILFKGTTAELEAISAVEGMIAYDVTLGKQVAYNGSAWVQSGSINLGEIIYPLTRTYSSNKSDGIFAYLATNGLFVQWLNPAYNYLWRDKIITVTQISNLDGSALAERAVDGDYRQGTGDSHTANTANAWWKVDFGSGKQCTPNRVGLRDRDYSTCYAPRNFKIQGSNNDSTWDDLLTITGDGPAINSWWSSAITGASAYRYLRIYQTGVNAQGSNYLVLGEIEFWGTLAEV